MPPKPTIALVSCVRCDATFKPDPRWKSKYCSMYCYSQARRIPLEQRFWSKVRKTDGCWLWTGSKTKRGYGLLGFKDVYSHRPFSRTAHAISYELAYGEIPEGLIVLHKCDNPPCVRPDHLWAGTYAENTADMFAKGRQVTHPGESSAVAKLTEQQAREIYRFGSRGLARFTELARIYPVSTTTISSIVHKRDWKHLHEGSSPSVTPANNQREDDYR